MKLVAVFVLVCIGVALAARDPFVCETRNGPNLYGFNQKKLEMKFPCKYKALRSQPCGDYLINLAAKNRWLGQYYQLDVLWISISDKEKTWKYIGRTSNKIAVKAHNSGLKKDMFNEKGEGNVTNSDLFETGISERAGVWVQDKNNTFRITFIPWDPLNKSQYPRSQWRFECFDEDMEYVQYPEQMCGGDDKKAVEERAEQLGYSPRYDYNVPYIDTFSDTKIETEDRECGRAREIFTRGGRCKKDPEWQVLVMSNCAEMLHNTDRTECITSYSCSPMQAFKACLKWGCKHEFQPEFGNKVSKHCESLSEKIFFCKNIKGAGNITERARASNCYKGFVKIEEPEAPEDEF